VQKAINLFERLVAISTGYSKELVHIIKMNVDSPGRFADLLSAALNVDYGEKQRVLQAVGIDQRLQRVLDLLRSELDRIKVAQEVEKRAKGDIEESRREYFLRQQLKTIQRELGDEDLSRKDAEEYTEKLEALGLADEISREAAREIERLRHIQPSSSEYQVIKTYLDRFFALPWGIYTDEKIDLPKVRDTLDEGHFGLEKVKERILEFLAVRKLNPTTRDPSSASSARPASARPRSANRSPARSGASSSASASAACATKPRSAATAALTSARCPAASSRGSPAPAP
jgi:ATP-dependent Lon protease